MAQNYKPNNTSNDNRCNKIDNICYTTHLFLNTLQICYMRVTIVIENLIITLFPDIRLV